MGKNPSVALHRFFSLLVGFSLGFGLGFFCLLAGESFDIKDLITESQNSLH